VASFAPGLHGTGIQTYQSRAPESSVNQGLNVGVKTVTDKGTTFLFGYHLWYMDHTGARNLVDYMLQNTPTDTDDDDNPILPSGFSLQPNYPNPFNAGTIISFNLPERAHVTLDIYNILGRKVRTLVNEEHPAGLHTVEWDGLDLNGSEVASGLYFYQLKCDGNSLTRKMLLLK